MIAWFAVIAMSYAGVSAVLWLVRQIIGHDGKCDHFFPERGIGCATCDTWYWHGDGERLQELEQEVERLRSTVFPLEDSRPHNAGETL